MRKIGYLLLFISCLFSFKVVLANDIKNITMDIYVDNNGNAHVTEKWTASLNSGTEGYKPYYNLGASEIIDFKVYLDNQEFNTLNYWDIDASFNEKAYKAGINEINDGYELCFGISKYGNNTYDTNTYLLAANISTNGCAVSLDLYKSESMTKEINKIMDTETTKIKRDVEELNLTGTLALNRKVTAVTNTSGDGIVGYELRMIVTITNKNDTKTVVEYRINNEGKRVFINNPYKLNS